MRRLKPEPRIRTAVVVSLSTSFAMAACSETGPEPSAGEEEPVIVYAGACVIVGNGQVIENAASPRTE